jgi:hypothetical protein
MFSCRLLLEASAFWRQQRIPQLIAPSEKFSGASNPYANGCKTPHTKAEKTAEKKEKEINKQKVCVNILQETGCV